MSPPPEPPDADTVVRLGPLRVGLRRRREPVREWREFGEAVDRLGEALGEALRETWPWRLVEWMARRRAR